MTWVRLDDAFCDHPKVVGLTATAFRAYVHSLCYSARHLTDGIVPKHAQIATRNARAELVSARLWALDDDESIVIHDFLEWNPSAATIRAKREEDSDRKRKLIPDGIPAESERSPLRRLLGIQTSVPSLEETSVETEVSSRPRDPIWDSLTTIFGPVANGTTAHGKRNRATRDLKRSGATGDSVQIAYRRWARLFDHATCTDAALAKHYPQLVAGVNIEKATPPCPECGVGGGHHVAGCGGAA